MKQNLKWVAFGAAMIGMGMSLPSCPGEQAMQQQLDSLQTTQADLQKKLQAHETQLKSMLQTQEQEKQLLEQMTSAIQAQRGALEELNHSLKEMQAQATAAQSKSATKPKASKKKGR